MERELRLNQDQDAALQEFNQASAKAAEIMKANCQPDQTLTPTGRLAAMEDRLTAMLHGLDQVQPALENSMPRSATNRRRDLIGSAHERGNPQTKPSSTWPTILDVLERRLSSIAKVDHRHLRASALEARLN